jgi:hypothetical protein
MIDKLRDLKFVHGSDDLPDHLKEQIKTEKPWEIALGGMYRNLDQMKGLLSEEQKFVRFLKRQVRLINLQCDMELGEKQKWNKFKSKSPFEKRVEKAI